MLSPAMIVILTSPWRDRWGRHFEFIWGAMVPFVDVGHQHIREAIPWWSRQRVNRWVWQRLWSVVWSSRTLWGKRTRKQWYKYSFGATAYETDVNLVKIHHRVHATVGQGNWPVSLMDIVCYHFSGEGSLGLLGCLLSVPPK